MEGLGWKKNDMFATWWRAHVYFWDGEDFGEKKEKDEESIYRKLIILIKDLSFGFCFCPPNRINAHERRHMGCPTRDGSRMEKKIGDLCILWGGV